MDIRQLRYFVAIVELGSFTAASRRLNISQSALSLQIRQLEEQFGVVLLERHSRGVSMTPAGAIFLDQARLIQENFNRIDDLLRPFRQSGTVQISVGVTPTTGLLIAPDLIDAARTRSEFLQVSLRLGFSDQMLESMKVGDLDMAFCYNPALTTDVIATPLFREDFYAVGPPESFVGVEGNANDEIDLREMPKIPLILASRSRRIRAFLDRLCDEYKVALNIAVEGESPDLKRELLLRNGCATIVSYPLYLQDIQSGAFCARRIVNPTISRDSYFVCRASLPKPIADFARSVVVAATNAKIVSGELHWRSFDTTENLITSRRFPPS